MNNVKIDRINTLARKAKSVGLTPEEKRAGSTPERIYCKYPHESAFPAG